MPDVFLLKAIAKSLLLPPTGLLLVALIGLAIIRRHPRTGRALATAAVATLLALSMPIVAGGLVRLIDDSPPIDLAVAKTAQAIVIPGGGVRRNALEYGGDTLGRLTLERVRYGARLAKATGLAGAGHRRQRARGYDSGSTADEGGAGERVRRRRALGGGSFAQHAGECRITARQCCRPRASHKIALVMHSFDVPRTAAMYTAAGLQVIPAPIGVSRREVDLPEDLVPGISALVTSYYACYELAALALQQVVVLR